MAHHLISESDQKIQIVYSTDRNSRTDRPMELKRLKDHCNHNISLKKIWALGYFLKVIDKLSNLKTLKSLDVYRFLKVYSDQNPYDIPAVRIESGLLRGYFQNIKIIEANKENLYRELFDCLSSVENIPKRSGRDRSEVLHIRRGDTTDIGTEWGILDFEYYERVLTDPQSMTICTDDIEFAKELRMRYQEAEILTPEDGDAWQTLKVMFEAKKLVMANSTLSWWSGWMASQNPTKEIYFPFPWRPEDPSITFNLIFDGALLTDSRFGLK